MSKKDLSTEYVQQKIMFKGQEIEVRFFPNRLEIRFDDAYARAMGYRDLDHFIRSAKSVEWAIAITGKPDWIELDGHNIRWKCPANMN